MPSSRTLGCPVLGPWLHSSLLLVALAACARRVDVVAARAALQDADRAFDRATTERRLDGWVDFFAEDGAMLAPGGPVSGKAAIRDHMARALSDTSFTLRWRPTASDVGAAGDLGYTVGQYEARHRDEKGSVAVRTGTYLTVWKRQADASWKVALDVGVEDLPRH